MLCRKIEQQTVGVGYYRPTCNMLTVKYTVFHKNGHPFYFFHNSLK